MLVCSWMMLITGRMVYDGSQIADSIVCVLVDARPLSQLCMSAGKLGLVVITVERYFKIVHAIAHRKYYRDWMTKVGVAMPWISGFCVMFLPTVATTKLVNGICRRNALWPNQAMSSVSLSCGDSSSSSSSHHGRSRWCPMRRFLMSSTFFNCGLLMAFLL